MGFTTRRTAVWEKTRAKPAWKNTDEGVSCKNEGDGEWKMGIYSTVSLHHTHSITHKHALSSNARIPNIPLPIFSVSLKAITML